MRPHKWLLSHFLVLSFGKTALDGRAKKKGQDSLGTSGHLTDALLPALWPPATLCVLPLASCCSQGQARGRAWSPRVRASPSQLHTLLPLHMPTRMCTHSGTDTWTFTHIQCACMCTHACTLSHAVTHAHSHIHLHTQIQTHIQLTHTHPFFLTH